MGSTRVEAMHVSTLVKAFRPREGTKSTLLMPPFQRGIVWSVSKQGELIRSLKAGFPVGSLLFFRKGTPDGTVSLLIDGLQRTSAISKYSLAPLEFMTIDDLEDQEALATFLGAYSSALGRSLPEEAWRDGINGWMRATRSLEPKSGFDPFYLVGAFNDRVAGESPVMLTKPLVDAANAFLGAIARECDISKIEIPVLFYEGQESELPEIFERINSTGTKLSKYEIFAASWIDQHIVVVNEKVISAIRDRYYTLMTQENISIIGVRVDGLPERMSLFDYLFGLGKVLSDTYPMLFGVADDPASMTSVAFSLATVCLGLPMAAMGSLPDRFDRDRTGRIDPATFEEALLESAAFVNAVLAPYIGLKLNSERSSTTAHTDLQIGSMVARAFAGAYVPGTWEARESASSDREHLRELLPQHYLVDVLQQNWRGSGDKRIFDMAWERSEEDISTSSLSPSRHYLRPFEAVEFDRVLEQWFGDQARLSQRSRAYVTMPAKAFLRFVYSGVVTVKDESKERFELDHVFPVSRLADMARGDEDGWPISAVSNLALFDWKTNREKSRLDLVEYLQRVPEPDRAKRRALVEKYLLMDVDQARIDVGEDGADEMTKQQYVAFLEARFAKMKQIVFESLGIG